MRWLGYTIEQSSGRVAELVDTLDSKSGIRKDVRVRVPPRPPTKKDWHTQSFLVGQMKRTRTRRVEHCQWQCEESKLGRHGALARLGAKEGVPIEL
jgi:hypothetical protein